MLEPEPWSQTRWVQSFALPLGPCGTLNKLPNYDAEHTKKSGCHQGGSLRATRSSAHRVFTTALGRGRGSRAWGRGGDSQQHTDGRWQDQMGTRPSCLRRCASGPCSQLFSPRSWVCSLHGAGQSQGSVDARVFLDFFPYGNGFTAF